MLLSLRDMFQTAFETKKKQEAEMTSSADEQVDTETAGDKLEPGEEQSTEVRDQD